MLHTMNTWDVAKMEKINKTWEVRASFLGRYSLKLEDLERFEKTCPFSPCIKSFDLLFFYFFTILYDPEKLSGRWEVVPIVKNNFDYKAMF